mgnify:CR=1 FL=1
MGALIIDLYELMTNIGVALKIIACNLSTIYAHIGTTTVTKCASNKTNIHHDRYYKQRAFKGKT